MSVARRGSVARPVGRPARCLASSVGDRVAVKEAGRRRRGGRRSRRGCGRGLRVADRRRAAPARARIAAGSSRGAGRARPWPPRPALTVSLAAHRAAGDMAAEPPVTVAMPPPAARARRVGRTAPAATADGVGAALDPRPRRRAGDSPGSCWTRPPATAVEPRPPARRWSRVDRQAAHRGGRAAHARPDGHGSSPGSSPARTPARWSWSAAATRRSPRCPPAGQASTRTRRGWPTLADAGAQGRAGADRGGCWSTPAATAARRCAEGWDAADVAGGLRGPDRAADARRRPDRPARCRTARGWRTRR